MTRVVWLAVLLSVCGCFSLGGRAAEPAPLPPQESPALQESAREAAAVSWLAHLQRAQTAADEYVARLAGVLVALHGAPARLPTTEPELAEAAERAESRMAAFATERDEDYAARLQASGTPVAPAGPNWGLLALYGIGGLMMAAGVAWALLVGKKLTGFGVAVAGVGVVAVARVLELYPWAPLVAVGLALLVGGLLLYDSWRDKRTLGTVVKSVEAGKAVLPAETKETMGKVMEAVQVRGSDVEAAVKEAKGG